MTRAPFRAKLNTCDRPACRRTDGNENRGVIYEQTYMANNNQFSEALVEQITKYFANFHNIQITQQQAQEYLNAFADFFAVVTDQTGDSKM